MPAPIAQHVARAAAAAAAAVAAARAADDGADVTAASMAVLDAQHATQPASLGEMVGEEQASGGYMGEDGLFSDDDGADGLEDDNAMRDVITPLVTGLLRLARLQSALQAHRDALGADVRAAVKEIIIATLAATTPGGATTDFAAAGSAGERSLGERLRSLPVHAYVALLEAVHAVLQRVFLRARTVHDVVVSILEAAPVVPSQRGLARGVMDIPGGRPVLLLMRDSADAVVAAADAAAQRWAKLLAVRAPVHAACLKAADFAEIVAVSMSFADELDSITSALQRRPVSGALRACVLAQARSLLTTTHASSVAKLQAALDSEPWTRCDVPYEFQRLADSLVAAGTGLLHGSEGDEAAGHPAPAANVVVDGKQYACVAAALMLLRCLAQYVDIANALPCIATEVLHRGCEVIQLFNGRSCQLVLGAGALRSAGLKSITAKTMALASQSLALAGALAPHVRAALARLLPPARHALLLTALDRAAADVRLHRSELHSKLVAIAGDRLAAHARQLPVAAAAWAEQPAPESSEAFECVSASDLALSIHKELSTLRRVLVPLLQPDEAAALFTTVGHVFDRTLAEGLLRAAACGGAAPAHASADATVLSSALAALPHGTDEQDLKAAAPALSACIASIRESAAFSTASAVVHKPVAALSIPTVESTDSMLDVVALSSSGDKNAAGEDAESEAAPSVSVDATQAAVDSTEGAEAPDQ